MMASKDQQITQLMEMGFGNNRVVRALQATAFKVEHWTLGAKIFHVVHQNIFQGVEAAMEWLLAHGDDPSLDEPFTEEEALQMKSNLEAPLEAAKKPLTEEEKAEKLAKLEELRKVRALAASFVLQIRDKPLLCITYHLIYPGEES